MNNTIDPRLAALYNEYLEAGKEYEFLNMIYALLDTVTVDVRQKVYRARAAWKRKQAAPFRKLQREKLEAFRESAAYERLLVKRAEECAAAYPGKRGEVRVAAADMKYAAKLTCGGRFTVCESGNILLGGIMVVFPEDNLALDCTFDNEFDRQKSGFAGKAGLVFDM